jgi:ABC-type glutathione transport system ATPase component
MSSGLSDGECRWCSRMRMPRSPHGLVSSVCILHDLAVVEQMFDCIAVLLGGLLVEVGETAEVLNHTQGTHMRRLWDGWPGGRKAHGYDVIG